MPFSESFSKSFRHEPLNIKEFENMLKDVMGEWNVGVLKQAFLDSNNSSIGDLGN